MKKYVIVSTYPESGSKNIGDQLITNSVTEMIQKIKGSTVSIETIWRGDCWNNVKDTCLEADAIIFACLAIRPKMSSIEYPFLNDLLESNIPLAVISAGTALGVGGWHENIFNYVDSDSKKLLIKLDEKCIFFSSRGFLTQEFCERIGMRNAKFGGDIAFANVSKPSFNTNDEIKNILISDPHYASDFSSSFKYLIISLKHNFPDSIIRVALHGENEIIKNISNQNDIEVIDIYKKKDKGLTVYDEVDLHVGYRVHAHVSCLKRGKRSYLLEQDGRGADYGLTLQQKISVPSYRIKEKNIGLRVVRKLMTELLNRPNYVSTVPVDMIISLIKNDKKNKFVKFNGLENQIEEFSINLTKDVELLP